MSLPWVDAFLSDTREVVESLLLEPLLPLQNLRRDVAAYRAQIESAPAADHELGLQLVDRATDLIGSATCDDTHRLVQIAVRYFVLDDDGDDDLASPFGFDDDVEVFNAVAVQLGRDDLLITLD